MAQTRVQPLPSTRLDNGFHAQSDFPTLESSVATLQLVFPTAPEAAIIHVLEMYDGNPDRAANHIFTSGSDEIMAFDPENCGEWKTAHNREGKLSRSKSRQAANSVRVQVDGFRGRSIASQRTSYLPSSSQSAVEVGRSPTQWSIPPASSSLLSTRSAPPSESRSSGENAHELGCVRREPTSMPPPSPATSACGYRSPPRGTPSKSRKSGSASLPNSPGPQAYLKESPLNLPQQPSPPHSEQRQNGKTKNQQPSELVPGESEDWPIEIDTLTVMQLKDIFVNFSLEVVEGVVAAKKGNITAAAEQLSDMCGDEMEEGELREIADMDIDRAVAESLADLDAAFHELRRTQEGWEIKHTLKRKFVMPRTSAQEAAADNSVVPKGTLRTFSVDQGGQDFYDCNVVKSSANKLLKVAVNIRCNSFHLNEAATRAYQGQDHARGKALRAQGLAQRALFLKTIAEAVEVAYKENVAMQARECEIDLHGLDVDAAMGLVVGLVRRHENHGIPIKLCFITGVGRHSSRNIPKLLPALCNLLSAGELKSYSRPQRWDVPQLGRVRIFANTRAATNR